MNKQLHVMLTSFPEKEKKELNNMIRKNGGIYIDSPVSKMII